MTGLQVIAYGAGLAAFVSLVLAICVAGLWAMERWAWGQRFLDRFERLIDGDGRRDDNDEESGSCSKLRKW